jgi:hypothetical protein
MFRRLLVLCVIALISAGEAQAHGVGTGWSSARPDGHAPIGVMGDHTHMAGGWMASYRLGTMSMNGNRTGTTDVSVEEVLGDYPVAPTSMTTFMNMFGLMFAPSSRITLSVMLPYTIKEMDHTTRMNQAFSTNTNGIGDLKVTALVTLKQWGRQRAHLNLGVSAPTGSVTETGDTPAGPNMPLPYPMQLGSGTWDLFPGATYLGQTDWWSWGAQAVGVIRTGENDEDYRLGNAFDATAWGARRISHVVSTSLRLAWASWGNIHGANPSLNPAMTPAADPNLRGGSRLNAGLGVNLLGRGGFVKGQRLAAEFLVPLYQDLDGPQLKTDWVLIGGWQFGW